MKATSTVALSAGANWPQNVDGQAAKDWLDADEEIHLGSGAAEILLRADGTIIINGKIPDGNLNGYTSPPSGDKMVLKA